MRYSASPHTLLRSPTYSTRLSSVFVFLWHYLHAFGDEANCAHTKQTTKIKPPICVKLSIPQWSPVSNPRPLFQVATIISASEDVPCLDAPCASPFNYALWPHSQFSTISGNASIEYLFGTSTVANSELNREQDTSSLPAFYETFTTPIVTSTEVKKTNGIKNICTQGCSRSS